MPPHTDTYLAATAFRPGLMVRMKPLLATIEPFKLTSGPSKLAHRSIESRRTVPIESSRKGGQEAHERDPLVGPSGLPDAQVIKRRLHLHRLVLLQRLVDIGHHVLLVDMRSVDHRLRLIAEIVIGRHRRRPAVADEMSGGAIQESHRVDNKDFGGLNRTSFPLLEIAAGHSSDGKKVQGEWWRGDVGPSSSGVVLYPRNGSHTVLTSRETGRAKTNAVRAARAPLGAPHLHAGGQCDRCSGRRREAALQYCADNRIGYWPTDGPGGGAGPSKISPIVYLDWITAYRYPAAAHAVGGNRALGRPG